MKSSQTWQRPLSVSMEIEAGDLDAPGYVTLSNTGTLGTFGAAVVPAFTEAYAATSGIAAISNGGTLGAFVGATVPALASADYDLDLSIDGAPGAQLTFSLLITDDWTGIAAKIQAALQILTGATETVTINSGKIRFTSSTTGAASAISLFPGTAGSGGGDFLAAVDALGAAYAPTLDTPVDGIAAFNGNYDVDVTVGGVLRQLTIVPLATDTWAQVAAKAQVALRAATTGLETVAIVGGQIKVTAEAGSPEDILVAPGTAGNTDIFAAIALLGTGVEYAVTVNTVSPGAEGQVTYEVGIKYASGVKKDFIITGLVVKTSANIIKSGLVAYYDDTTGNVVIADNAETTELATGDLISFTGTFISDVA